MKVGDIIRSKQTNDYLGTAVCFIGDDVVMYRKVNAPGTDIDHYKLIYKHLVSVDEEVTNHFTLNYLEKANELINGERAKDYGPVIESFTRIAVGWSEILKTEVTANQIAACMIWLKLSRLAGDKFAHDDSWIDIAGYVGCVDKMNKGN